MTGVSDDDLHTLWALWLDLIPSCLAAIVILSDDQLLFRGEEITTLLKANVASRAVSCCKWGLARASVLAEAES